MKSLTSFSALSLSLLISLMSVNVNALTFAESVASDNQHFITGHFGISKGGFTLGADYEYAYDRTYTIGGYLKLMPKDEPSVPSITAIGAFFRPHIYKRTWNFYLSPGFGLMMVDGAVNDETVLGPSIAWGLSYQLNDKFAMGFENMKLYSWTGSTYKGLLSDTLLLNVQFAF